MGSDSHRDRFETRGHQRGGAEDELERIVADHVERVLMVEQVGREREFFAYGLLSSFGIFAVTGVGLALLLASAGAAVPRMRPAPITPDLSSAPQGFIRALVLCPRKPSIQLGCGSLATAPRRNGAGRMQPGWLHVDVRWRNR